MRETRRAELFTGKGNSLPAIPRTDSLFRLTVERKERFERLLPGTKITEITYGELTPTARNFFESKSQGFIQPEDYLPMDFSALFKVSHENGDVNYLAQQLKYFCKTSSEQLTYLIEFREDVRIGHGEVRLPDYLPVPYVGFTQTETGVRGQDLATRRLHTWNAYCQTFYNQPLYSNTLFVTTSGDRQIAKELWQDLVQDGFAESFIFTDKKKGNKEIERFRFLTSNIIC